jgi:hypothetical protein
MSTFCAGACDHDIVYSYVYSRMVIGHGTEAQLTRDLAAWIATAEAELGRRRLLVKAKAALDVAYDAHHRDGSGLSRQVRSAPHDW